MCGISGYISNKKAPLYKTIIKTLGVFNDTRGGDSCGLFIDDDVEIGIDKKACFSNFIEESKLFNSKKSAKIVFTHCRKRSIGVISENTAQPVVIKNKNGDIDFVLMHNGTIYNTDELWEEHCSEKLDYNLTDSQKMAALFYNYGYESLSKYQGSAAFVILDYRENRDNPKILFFRGESLSTWNASIPAEERPLFFIYDKNAIIFSSIYSSLRCITESEIFSLIPNQLCEYVNNELVVRKAYDRSGQYQINRKTTSNYGNHTKQESLFHDRTYDEYDYYEGNYYDYNKNFKKPEKWFKNDNKGKSQSLYSRDKLSYCASFGVVKYGADLAHGKYKTSCFGYNTTNSLEEVWFFQGHLLLGGKKTYTFLEEQFSKQPNFTYQEFVNYFFSAIRKFSAYPVLSLSTMRYEIEDEYGNIAPYNGKFTVPFDTNYVTKNIVNGVYAGQEKCSYYNYLSAFNGMINRINEYDFDYNEENTKFIDYFNLNERKYIN